MELKGKRAIVLGGTSGIGLATARQLLEGGASVLAGSRSPENISRAKEEIPAAEVVQIDVLDRSALQTLFEQNDGFDILVNAAYGGDRALGPFLQMDMDAFQGSFRKVWGYANSIRYGVPHMPQDGAIVLITGMPARRTGPGVLGLGAPGGAIETLVRGCALELKPRRVNAVSPGIIDTNLYSEQGPERTQSRLSRAANFPIPRAGTADECAAAVLFLVRNDYMTGSVIDVEGGALLP